MIGAAEKTTIPRWRVRRHERDMDRVLKSGALADRFGDDTARVMRGEVLAEFRRLLPDLPDIGRDNVFVKNFLWAPAALALYRVVLKHGGTLDDTGEILHRSTRAYWQRVPEPLRRWTTRYMFSQPSQRRWERAARRSQARRYPHDWVFEVVPSDGRAFDFGLDITECAAVKYLHDHGADELTPFLCDGDLVQAAVLGYRLDRTKTLAWGCDKCDFRFCREGVTAAPWPPRFAERTCGQPTPRTPDAAPVR